MAPTAKFSQCNDSAIWVAKVNVMNHLKGCNESADYNKACMHIPKILIIY